MVPSALLNQTMTVAQAGSDALETAVRQHARFVYRITYSVLRNHHDAEDATQEVFLKVLRYGKRLEQVEDQRNWLGRIAWRVAVDRRKKSRIEVQDVGPDEIELLRSSVAGADELLLGAEMAKVMEKVMASLPEKLRDPMVLSTVEEMMPADISAVLGINDAAVRSRLFRARQAIKEKLAALLEGSHGS